MIAFLCPIVNVYLTCFSEQTITRTSARAVRVWRFTVKKKDLINPFTILKTDFFICINSNSRILFVGKVAWESLSESEMPNLEAIIQIDDFSLLYATTSSARKSMLENLLSFALVLYFIYFCIYWSFHHTK